MVAAALVLAATCAWCNRHRRDVLAPALFLLVGAALYGLIEGNVGTAIRHRAQFTWVVLLLAGPGIAGWLAEASGQKDRALAAWMDRRMDEVPDADWVDLEDLDGLGAPKHQKDAGTALTHESL